MEDKDKIKELLETELELFNGRTAGSLQLARRGVQVMPAGVPTSVVAMSPYPLAITHGRGPRVFDIDRNSYVDYANGFGTTVFGHAHPLIDRAIRERSARGVHFGALSEEAVEWAEELVVRFGLDWIRFSPSGTEATMDAIRLARARTGREKIVKIEGAYHGSHPEALVSTNMSLDDDAGPDGTPASRPWGLGLTRSTVADVIIVPFNDLEAAERALESAEVAAVITEPILFNVGTIFPEPGYLAELKAICEKHGTVLIFDETKTGMTVAHGGASELFGVTPHIKTLGKGIGGGIGVGALGETSDTSYELVATGKVPHLGTFPGNPLVAAAGLAAVRDVMVPAAYQRLEEHREALREGLERIIAEYELGAYVAGAGAKACLVWSSIELRNFRDYRRNFDFETGSLAWLWLLNRGVMLAPGQDEQLTFSITHGETELSELLGGLEDLAKTLRS